MIKLIKLEWKKNHIGKYIRNALILTLVLSFFVILQTRELDADGTAMMFGKSMLNVAVELFTHMCYIIFVGVMLSSFVISDYENKTIHLMFSYPIKRQKILLSKICAVWIFNFIALVCSKLLIYALILLTVPFTHVSTASIQMGELAFHLNILLSSAARISISFVALLIGMQTKSSKATIVTAVVISILTQGNIGTFTLIDNIPFYSLLLGLACISTFLCVYNVETKDVP